MRFSGRTIVGVIGALLVPWIATATVVTVGFSGTAMPPPAGLVVPAEPSGSISPGDSVSGFFRYDSVHIDLNPDPRFGDYVYTDPIFCLDVTVGQAHLATDPTSPFLRAQILDDYPIPVNPAPIDRFGVWTKFTAPWNPSRSERLGRLRRPPRGIRRSSSVSP